MSFYTSKWTSFNYNFAAIHFITTVFFLLIFWYSQSEFFNDILLLHFYAYITNPTVNNIRVILNYNVDHFQQKAVWASGYLAPTLHIYREFIYSDNDLLIFYWYTHIQIHITLIIIAKMPNDNISRLCTFLSHPYPVFSIFILGGFCIFMINKLPCRMKYN